MSAHRDSPDDIHSAVEKWYLLAVVHEALLCYCTRTPYTTKHLLCLDNAANLQMFYNHIASWNVLI